MIDAPQHKVLMLFLDGVGIGLPDPSRNPFFRFGFSPFQYLFSALPSLNSPYLNGPNAALFPVDARMGIEGIPQSGTGQASIFCGMNAPLISGLHYGPFPHSSTLQAVRDNNIFIRLKSAGKTPFFANAYPKIFFNYLKAGKRRLSVTTLAYNGAGLRLNTVTDVRRGHALTAEITNENWNVHLGYRLPVIAPKTAARRLLRIALKNDFTLYEYFLTDYIGHGRIIDADGKVHRQIESFLYTLFFERPENLTLFLVSDHGNYEDLSERRHTMNPAIGLIAGTNASELSAGIQSLEDISSSVFRALSVK